MTVIAFPGKQKADIAKEAREFADNLDAGEFGNVEAAMVITSGGSLQCHYWGEGINIVEAIAMLETAKFNLVQKLAQ